MSLQPLSGRAAPAAIDPAFRRTKKRAVLFVLGPFYFLYIAFVPLFCGKRQGFRGWYWPLIKQACSRLLWLLSIRTEMTNADRTTLAADTGSIIVINHRSHLDGFALMDVMPDAKWITFAAKKELCDAALLRSGFKAAGLVEIDRKSGTVALETITAAVQAMPARRSVVLFPEGTRTGSESLGAFKAGAVIVARTTGRTIRPIVIHASDSLLPRGKYLPKSGTILVEVLPSFECDLSASVDNDVARLRGAMMAVFDEQADR
ncbi:lysophospholipid acyltransferase family protein [Sulfitobacter aestuariivivens]|uniref:1-acyl-sn-glycerol-3-phosphate acyltransferase n=1 Tax=Sulfitobacter aestuariivivens TaxID=2766981 RepID=A0A927D0U8_9RHOB|nr:lysophospholipid acyltransferase family protein [Sulfitobacter aestuariivivens]MBD3662361.1 1-acyl-sn-glycerol-3-phosphate acyltransferase [Sulfitobacter aestuariivivens]